MPALEENLQNANSTPDLLQDTMESLVKKHGEDLVNHCMEDLKEYYTVLIFLVREMGGLIEKNQDFTEKMAEISLILGDYQNYVRELPEEIQQISQLAMEQVEGFASILPLVESSGKEVSAEVASLLSIKAVRPKNYTMQIDAISNQLVSLGSQTKLMVGRKGSRPVNTTVTLDLPSHMKIEGGATLTSYDKSVLNGVTSLLECGNTMFTIPMLYHAMTGRKNPTVDEALYDELTSKLERMRRMMLTIDLTEENEARYVTAKDGGMLAVTDVTLEGYLLPLNKIRGLINGKPAELYQLIQPPPLYSYSKMRRQLASVKISLLGAPVNNNATTIPLRTYLLQRIELMRNRKNSITSNVILYEAVYQELGAQEADKTRKKRIRNYAAAFLDFFVEQGYIGGYSEFKKGRNIAGINIMLEPAPPEQMTLESTMA